MLKPWLLDLFQAGVQNMLQFYIPEVVGVEEVFDEADKISQEMLENLEERIMTRKPNPRT